MPDVSRPTLDGGQFIDEARVLVAAGRGGDGACTFRREKFVPRGGPDGGCGGRGGSVVFVATSGKNTLYYFQHHRHFRAADGTPGTGSNCNGANGADQIVEVPPGTLIRDDQGAVLADLLEPGDEFPVARGGRGGRGNKVFCTSRRQAPHFAEKGEPGEERWVRLELRLIAEVGLVGFPNVGKSTLLSRVSAAKPKVAAYPFTTLAPKLGVVALGEDRHFTMADLPGLIEGASEGKGLGDRFLRHAERTRLLVHLVDVSGWEGRNPVEDYRTIRAELEAHHGGLAAKPEMIVANKMDVPASEEHLAAFSAELGLPVIPISAVTGLGVDVLIRAIGARLAELPPESPRERPMVVHRPEPLYVVEKVDGGFRVRGERVERLVAMTDHENDEACLRMERILCRLGVYEALEAEGCVEGDTVTVGRLEFVFIPDKYSR